MARDPHEPALALRFGVVVDGVALGMFTGVSGLQGEYEVLEFKEGGNNGYTQRLPGRRSFTNVKLTRALDADSGALASWFCGFGDARRRGTATITAYDGNAEHVATWTLAGVWPVRYTGPTFSSTGLTAAVETVEIAHNGFVLS
jgi:phage tail-like protein